MNTFEQHGDPIENENRYSLHNEEFRNELREAFADELEDLAADPQFSNLGLDEELPEQVRSGEKAGWSTPVKEALERAAREFGMGSDDLEELEDIFLEEEEDF